MDKTFETIKQYNACASRFMAQHMDLGIYQKFMGEFSKLLKPGAQILDLGCGPGNNAKFLLEQHKDYHLLGVDLSSEMLRLARQNVPQAEFLLQDLRLLELTRQFDAIILSFCIIHLYLDETQALLERTFSWLTPSGYLYLNFMQGKDCRFETPSFSAQPLFFNYYSAPGLVEHLEKTGYRIVSQRTQDYLRSNQQIVTEVFIIAQK